MTLSISILTIDTRLHDFILEMHALTKSLCIFEIQVSIRHRLLYGKSDVNNNFTTFY